MSTSDMAPPASIRCQIYTTAIEDDKQLERCANDGTGWVKWSGCSCIEEDDGDCMDDFYSWECGEHGGLS